MFGMSATSGAKFCFRVVFCYGYFKRWFGVNAKDGGAVM
jgi:hypothetical protein